MAEVRWFARQSAECHDNLGTNFGHGDQSTIRNARCNSGRRRRTQPAGPGPDKRAAGGNPRLSERTRAGEQSPVTPGGGIPARRLERAAGLRGRSGNAVRDHASTGDAVPGLAGDGTVAVGCAAASTTTSAAPAGAATARGSTGCNGSATFASAAAVTAASGRATGWSARRTDGGIQSSVHGRPFRRGYADAPRGRAGSTTSRRPTAATTGRPPGASAGGVSTSIPAGSAAASGDAAATGSAKAGGVRAAIPESERPR